MSPNWEGQILESSHIEPIDENVHFALTPISDLSFSTTPSPSEGNPYSDSESNPSEIVDHQVNITGIINEQRNCLPLEHNLRELLVRVSNTESLDIVTQIKLRVITTDVALQQLSVYLPALRELTLDGSVVFSLRDLGNGLRNLKNLRVNRCQLSCIDGVLGLEDLEELYAADNDIKDLASCAFLSNLKILDARRNAIKHFGSLSFLNLCDELKHLLLEGNAAADEFSGYRQTVKRILPNLDMLDNLPLEQDDFYGSPHTIFAQTESKKFRSIKWIYSSFPAESLQWKSWGIFIIKNVKRRLDPNASDIKRSFKSFNLANFGENLYILCVKRLLNLNGDTVIIVGF